ncbi:hypothetical protein OG943_21090 [Amycolatopsis sp. NBC_00345]|uniref:hypothetical protein n=1 Tax=Amycolatopsis sp. NBC_00345 TaxID=2975955 RepID=UPI002E267B4E
MKPALRLFRTGRTRSCEEVIALEPGRLVLGRFVTRAVRGLVAATNAAGVAPGK